MSVSVSVEFIHSIEKTQKLNTKSDKPSKYTVSYMVLPPHKKQTNQNQEYNRVMRVLTTGFSIGCILKPSGQGSLIKKAMSEQI